MIELGPRYDVLSECDAAVVVRVRKEGDGKVECSCMSRTFGHLIGSFRGGLVVDG